MNIVLFTKEEIDSGKPLPPRDERAKHLLKVLHKSAGDTFDAGIINGMAGTGTITAVDDDGVHVSFEAQTDGKPLYPVVLIVGFPRPIQLKRLFRDAAGLGVSRICLCGTELGEKSYRDSTIVERGAALAALTDGTAQAKSTHVPELELYDSVADCLAALKDSRQEDSRQIRVLLDNIKPENTLYHYLQGQSVTPAGCTVYAAIGSERGWTDHERDQFRKEGYALCSMGQRVLRTETAVTVATTLILQAMELV
ncbi:MAG: RsmE family RNA methyltransferase [Treponemataceae bacterium]|nr:RsmE family RNA methyltransferase [Treponemataceae bacterium]